LNTRESTYIVFKGIEISNTKTIQLDFTGVEFMSRSFADEFFKYKRTLETERNILIILVNINKEISQMLHAVSISNSAGKPVRKFNSITHIKFTSQKALSDYLLAL
jgi:anti-anti-sigma regulatory factor